LDWLETNLCIDTNHVWAQGDSNGGMFAFDLAADPRTAPRFAGIAAGVGLPHYGYSRGVPLASSSGHVSMIGVWGKADTTVPPIPKPHSGSAGHPDRTFDTEYNGWYYQSHASTAARWAKDNGCGGATSAVTDAWGIDAASDLACTRYTGCRAGVDVVGCLHSKGHSTGAEGYSVMLAYMSAHRKVPATDACAECATASRHRMHGRRRLL
jgi:poly(3-hydroxybutyrate) depolymerase